jgi:hypothetical protein
VLAQVDYQKEAGKLGWQGFFAEVIHRVAELASDGRCPVRQENSGHADSNLASI